MAGSRCARHLAAAANVDGGGDHVVAGLPAVDVVVGVRVRQAADHLVGVHVGGGAAAGLEDVHHEWSS